MEYRNLDSTTPVSEIGLGTWQLGGQWGAEISEPQALAMLGMAVDRGINFFDTADVYGMGRSEELIGKFLRQSKAEVFVATKLGRFPPQWPEAYNLAGFRGYVEASLRRLGVETLDLVQLHCVPKLYLASGEVFDWLVTLRQEGKIRRFGASVETIAEAELCLQCSQLASLQIIFNIFRQRAADCLFDKAQQRGVAIIVRLPLASGVLSGGMTRQTTFDKRDHRNFNRDGAEFNVGETFAGLPFEKAVELAEVLKPLAAAEYGLAKFALRWCLDFPAVTTVIPGASSPQQVRDNAVASSLAPLSPEIHDHLRQFYLDRVEPCVRGEI